METEWTQGMLIGPTLIPCFTTQKMAKIEEEKIQPLDYLNLSKSRSPLFTPSNEK